MPPEKRPSRAGAARSRPAARPISEARALRYQEREQAIIEAAYRQLRSGTHSSISVTDIIRETGLSTRAFYGLFASKDELVLAMCRREFTLMTTRLARAVAAADTPVEGLRAWVGEALQAGYDANRAARTRVVTSPDARTAAGFRQVNREGMAAQREILAEVLREGREDGSFPMAEPDLDARAIQAVVSSFVDARVNGDVTPGYEEARDRIVTIFGRAFGTPPRKLTAALQAADAPAPRKRRSSSAG